MRDIQRICSGMGYGVSDDFGGFTVILDNETLAPDRYCANENAAWDRAWAHAQSSGRTTGNIIALGVSSLGFGALAGGSTEYVCEREQNRYAVGDILKVYERVTENGGPPRASGRRILVRIVGITNRQAPELLVPAKRAIEYDGVIVDRLTEIYHESAGAS